jgi:hypothetical protein
MMRKWLILAVAAVLVLAALGACSGPKATPAADQPTAKVAATKAPAEAKPAATAEKVATPEPAETEAPAEVEATATPAEVQVEATSTGGDDSLTVESRDEGLDKLKSYRMRWQYEWSGTDSDGKEQKASWDWTEEYQADPQGLHLVWKGDDTSSQTSSMNMEMWQIGQTTYVSSPDPSGKASCISISSSDEKDGLTKGLFSPGSLGGVSNARYVGDETVNGIAAKHFKYNESAETLDVYGKVSGELWVAKDGGYVVKDVMSWQGAGVLFGGDSKAKGNGKWTWELTQIDQPVDIKAPENCGGAAKDLPMMADAKDQSSIGDMTTYTTAGKIADVVAFYQKEMPSAGWKAVEGEPMVTEGYAALSFTQQNLTAQVTITSSDDATQVMINVTKQGQE